jgi:hypothetical protein
MEGFALPKIAELACEKGFDVFGVISEDYALSCSVALYSMAAAPVGCKERLPVWEVLVVHCALNAAHYLIESC